MGILKVSRKNIEIIDLEGLKKQAKS